MGKDQSLNLGQVSVHLIRKFLCVVKLNSEKKWKTISDLKEMKMPDDEFLSSKAWLQSYLRTLRARSVQPTGKSTLVEHLRGIYSSKCSEPETGSQLYNLLEVTI